MDWPSDAVFVREEYGFRHWLWQPEGTPEAVVEAFRALRAKDGMMNGGCLPGVWRRLIPAADAELWALDRQLAEWESDDVPDMDALIKEALSRALEWPDRWHAVTEDGEVVGEVVVPERRHEAHIHMRADSSLHFRDGPCVDEEDDVVAFFAGEVA